MIILVESKQSLSSEEMVRIIQRKLGDMVYIPVNELKYDEVFDSSLEIEISAGDIRELMNSVTFIKELASRNGWSVNSLRKVAYARSVGVEMGLDADFPPNLNTQVSKVLYHGTDSKYMNKILQQGLKPSQGDSWKPQHNPRVYMAYTKSQVIDMMLMFNEVFIQRNKAGYFEPAIFEVDITDMRANWYRDPMSWNPHADNQMYAVWTPTHIPPEKITLVSNGWDDIAKEILRNKARYEYMVLSLLTADIERAADFVSMTPYECGAYTDSISGLLHAVDILTDKLLSEYSGKDAHDLSISLSNSKKLAKVFSKGSK